MKLLVTGGSGQLGHDVSVFASAKGWDVLSPTHAELDICDQYLVQSYFREHCPDAVIHCAAWTAVDAAEDEEEACRAINVGGTENLTEACRESDIPILYISTDYVFNGKGEQFWKVDDPTDPINAYGLSKRDGENAVKKYSKHYIVRISWVFGSNGKNFLKTMINLSKKYDTVRVVSDQYGSPTYTYDLAPLLCEMVVSGKYGVYHAHNSGVCTWYDVAVETFKAAGIDMTVVPITSAEYPMKAARPLNSRLDLDSLKKAGFSELPDWKDAVHRFVCELERSCKIL